MDLLLGSRIRASNNPIRNLCLARASPGGESQLDIRRRGRACVVQRWLRRCRWVAGSQSRGLKGHSELGQPSPCQLDYNAELGSWEWEDANTKHSLLHPLVLDETCTPQVLDELGIC